MFSGNRSSSWGAMVRDWECREDQAAASDVMAEFGAVSQRAGRVSLARQDSYLGSSLSSPPNTDGVRSGQGVTMG